MSRYLVFIGAVLALLGVAAGAMGAHALQAGFDPRQQAWFRTAAEYQMYHAFALIALGLWARGRAASSAIKLSAAAFLIGLTLFCGSLYGLALGGGMGLAAAAPFGGLAFLLGWAALAWATLSDKDEPR